MRCSELQSLYMRSIGITRIVKLVMPSLAFHSQPNVASTFSKRSADNSAGSILSYPGTRILSLQIHPLMTSVSECFQMVVNLPVP